MSIKKIEVRICDNCKKEVTKNILKMSSVPNEGFSEITLNRNTYDFDDLDFCSIDCFVDNVKKKLYK